MKTIFTTLILSAAMAIVASADFENWKAKDGSELRLKLVEVVRENDTLKGKFETEDGQTVIHAADALAPEEAARLDSWKPAAPVPAGSFDEMLAGNLVILNDGKFVEHAPAAKPAKHYVFYYTASWCGPCRAYTPELVKFYERTKTADATYELILLTSDRSEEKMIEYAVKNKMQWPHVKFDQARAIKAKLGHGVRGIPSVIICDPEGNVISRDRNLENVENLLTK